MSYLDVGKFATATIDIDNVKHKDGATYTADAKVPHTARRRPIQSRSTYRHQGRQHPHQGSAAFTRLDFGVGTDPAKNPEEQVGTDLTIEMVLTLKKT